MTAHERCDVLIVGGGPAGSTCARSLRAGGLDVLVLDRAQFPRDKLCAGWITPIVLEELGLDADQYRRGRVFQPMTGFRIGRIDGPSVTIRNEQPVSFGIRRCEFDEYLLRRCKARLALGEPLKEIRRNGRSWIVNERIETPLVVAAGGHFCPVARMLGVNNPKPGPLVVSEEVELALSPAQAAECSIDPEVPEIYFCDDLLGYGWCIRKGNFLNVGLGRADKQRLSEHVGRFCQYLRREGRIADGLPGRLRGHAYLLYEQSSRPLVEDGVVWIGDAAGLAYSESGEGIRPAIESGLMAAEAILAARGDYRRERLTPYRDCLEARFGRRRAKTPADRSMSAVRHWVGRWLLRRSWFVRHIVLDRWFLHSGQSAYQREMQPGRIG